MTYLYINFNKKLYIIFKYKLNFRNNIMYQTFFKTIMILIPLLFIIGCGEITYDEESSNKNIETTSQNSDVNHIPSESEVDSAQQANETIGNNEEGNSVLEKIMATTNTLATTNNNEENLLSISAWIVQITNEVSELTAKNFNTLITDISPSQLSSINSNIFSNNTLLEVEDDGTIGHVDGDILIMKGDCNIGYLDNSILICTGNVDIAHSTNNIIIADGDIEISHDGSHLTGSIIYNKKHVDVSHSSQAVFIGSNSVETAHLTDSDCINVKSSDSSHGACNHIQSANFTVNE